ncbi:hypothetical protein OOU_Y34scaffold00500g9 [Pyricularia oryzae Y34]|uniref:Uncharacterized protein n=2 Tax=Pyricularia oryzae TaxID=318829 RepID=A0AA97PLT5_PYRO3|nr:hypothetical protein OOU_Y34scaffold00500g9 [Pyricularia oryzae Y34]
MEVDRHGARRYGGGDVAGVTYMPRYRISPCTAGTEVQGIQDGQCTLPFRKGGGVFVATQSRQAAAEWDPCGAWVQSSKVP